MNTSSARVIAGALALLTAAVAIGGAQSAEEFARRRYDSGLAFLNAGRFAEAIKDFQEVVNAYGMTSVADDALLQIATYQLETLHDVDAAKTSTDTLLKDYPDGDAAPMALVLLGRLSVARRRTPADVDAALANFDRVPRFFPNSGAIPAAEYYAGETLRLVRRDREAGERYRQVLGEYPHSVWALKANLGAAASLVAVGRVPDAMAMLQRAHDRAPRSPEGGTALAWNTILYRLYIRPPAQPPYAFSGRNVPKAGKLAEPLALAVDPRGQLVVANENVIAVYDEAGTATRTIGSAPPLGLFLDRGGQLVSIHKGMVAVEGSRLVPVSAAIVAGKTRRFEDLLAGVAPSTGGYLLADDKGKTIIRVADTGTFTDDFAPVAARRLAINANDEVAALGPDAKSITMLDPAGKPIAPIAPRGQGYEIKDAVDLAYDGLGHLYVLQNASVLVFTRGGRLVTTLAVPERSPGAFRDAKALALDPAARLYIYDKHVQRVLVYQ